MTAFVDEFRNEPTLLRAALEAAVGPLPDAEVLPDGSIKIDGRLCAPSSTRALDTAREALAVLVASARVERDAAAAGQAPHLETPPATDRGTDAYTRPAAAIDVDVRSPRCGAIDPDEGACLLDPGHEGEHFYTMGRLA